MEQLIWVDTNNIKLDDTIVFGKGWDSYGFEHLRQEAGGSKGNYLIWKDQTPSGQKWSLYRDSDGEFSYQSFDSEKDCKYVANRMEAE